MQVAIPRHQTETTWFPSTIRYVIPYKAEGGKRCISLARLQWQWGPTKEANDGCGCWKWLSVLYNSGGAFTITFLVPFSSFYYFYRIWLQDWSGSTALEDMLITLSLISPVFGFMEDLCLDLGVQLQVFLYIWVYCFSPLFCITVLYYDVLFGGCYFFFQSKIHY